MECGVVCVCERAYVCLFHLVTDRVTVGEGMRPVYFGKTGTECKADEKDDNALRLGNAQTDGQFELEDIDPDRGST